MNEADGVGHSRELQTLWTVERLGAMSVFGRPLYAREIFRMTAAENVYNAKRARDNSEEWAAWAENNPEAAKLLVRAETIRGNA